MRMSGVLGTVAAAAAAATMALAVAGGAAAEDKPARWKLHMAFPSKMTLLGDNGVRFVDTINEISNGSFRIRAYEPNALVPAYNYIDALGQGSVDAGWGVAGIHVAKNPAFAFYAAVPFGPNEVEFLSWLRHGGGLELMDSIYGKVNVKGFDCDSLPPEASGWFRKEMKTLEDFKGLKIRFFGYGGKVLGKFGASAQLIAGGDIYPALELGTIDATEFSIPSADESLGFYQIAKHYYFPGWHQPATLQNFEVHRPTYDALSDAQKKLIDVVCGYSVASAVADGPALQYPAMQRIQQKGVTLHRWSDEILDQLEAAWVEVIEEDAKQYEDVAKVWASLKKFREDFALWKKMGYVD